MTFLLGIPRCNETSGIFGETIAAVRLSSRQPDYAFIVDNGDEPLSEVSGFEIFRPGRNTGCAGAWNIIFSKAFEHSPNSWVVALNADCAVTPHTFEKMQTSSREMVCGHAFGCFRLSQTVWNLVGPFDEEFYPAYWEDTDYRRRLRLAGVEWEEWPIDEEEVLYPGRARHVSGIVHGKDLYAGPYQGWTGEKGAWFQERLKANHQRYVDKWGGGPGAETFSTPFQRPANRNE